MKTFSVFILLSLSYVGISQNKTLSYIPDSCDYFIAMDLKRITSNISIEEADGFQFIKTISENYLQLDPKNVSLKNIGVDFQGHAAFFSGKSAAKTFSGTIVPIKDGKAFVNKTISDNIIRQALLAQGSYVEGKAVYLINEGFFIAATVSATEQLAFSVTDSIFDANGWEKPFRWDFFMNEGFDWADLELIEATEEIIDEEYFEEEVEAVEEGDFLAPPPEDLGNPFEEEAIESFDFFTDDTRYYEIKDSVLEVLSEKQAHLFLAQLKTPHDKLIQNSAAFKQSMNKASDVTLFINSTSLDTGNEFPYAIRSNPFFNGLNSFLENTWQTGYMNFTSTGMTIDWLNYTGEQMTRVVSAMTKSKFDKKLLNYIPASTSGYMVVNVNTKAAYDEAKKVYMPLLDASEDGDLLLASALWSLLDEIINEEALFDMYFSKAFVSFNGIRDMVVKKTSYDYDPETFEYEEREETGVEKIPALTFGLSTSRSYLVTKFMNAMAAKDNGMVKKEAGYYKMKSGPIPGVTFYLMVKGDIIIWTNEQDIIRNNPNGYGKNALSGAQAKKAGNTKMMYAHMNGDNIPAQLNQLITNPSDRKFMKAITEKSGELEIEMGDVKKDYYAFKATYKFHGNHKSGVHYLMEVMNLMMSYEDEYYDDF